jgi:hypothetical protein
MAKFLARIPQEPGFRHSVGIPPQVVVEESPAVGNGAQPPEGLALAYRGRLGHTKQDLPLRSRMPGQATADVRSSCSRALNSARTPAVKTSRSGHVSRSATTIMLDRPA